MDDTDYRCTVIEGKFNKALMTKKDYEDFEKSIKCQISKKPFKEGDLSKRSWSHYQKILKISMSRL